MRKSHSKLANVQRAMNAFTAPAPQPAEPQPYWAKCECCDGEGGHHYYDRDAYEPCECCEGSSGRWLDANDNEVPAPVVRTPECALADCHEAAAYTCVCCNRRVCWYDISGADEMGPGICHECLFACAGGPGCQVVSHEPQPHTCHLCGAVVEGDALTVQTAADGGPMFPHWLCAAHLKAGTERLKAAIREQREGEE